MVAVSYDSEDVLKKFAEKQEITFPLVSDAESKVIDKFGLRNEEVNNPRLRGIPHPGTVIVDQKGVIRAKLFVEDYRKRHPPEAIMKAVKSLQRETSGAGD